MNRLWALIRTVLGMFFSGFEEAIPLEARLADDRARRTAKVRQMMDGATDIGAAAEMMVQELARARIDASNLRKEAASHLQAAKAAESRGDTKTAQDENDRASVLANELAQAEQDVADLQATVQESLRDKEDAKRMVLEQADQLAELARNDIRLVAKARMAKMHEGTLALKESLLGLGSGDDDGMRNRAQEGVRKQEARVKARTDIVNALWQRNRRGQAARMTEVSARGAEILQELQAEVGYVPAPAVSTPVEETRQAGSKSTGA